jgi:3-deoxy-D-manno-octulosonate 8-phosphate phosphatase KdsC-like HAD superfamily phosphatase
LSEEVEYYSKIWPNQSKVKELASRVQALILDFDGVFTDNTESIGLPGGGTIKWRSHYDGQGISLLRDAGLRIAIATSAGGPSAAAAEAICHRWNHDLPSVKSESANPWAPVTLFKGVGGPQKAAAVSAWLPELAITPEHCAVMGDDLTDWSLLQMAGLKAAPCTAERVIRAECNFVSRRPGGGGAIRDLANFILAAKGIDPRGLRLC